MGAWLFEDVVVSPSAFRRRGGGFPVSVGLHAAVITVAVVAFGRSPIESPPAHDAGILALPPGLDVPVRLPPREGTMRAAAAARPGPRPEAPRRVPAAQLIDATLEPAPERPPIGDEGVPVGEDGGGCLNCTGTSDTGGDTGGGSDVSILRSVVTVRPGGNIQPPRKLHHVNPQYPEPARSIRFQGTVVLECTIGIDGRVTDVSVVQGSPLLTGAAVAAVQQWTYTPTELNGRPVAVIMTVTVHFGLP